jgi:hypothetical protein
MGRAASRAFRAGSSDQELARRTGLARNTIRAALRSDLPSRSKCPERPSKLEPFREEIQELLRRDPPLTGVRVRELLEPLGFDGGKTIVDDYLREVRPLFVRLRDASADVVPPWGVLPVGSWEPSGPVPVGHGRLRRAWVVVACLGYSRAGAGALIFSKEAPRQDASRDRARDPRLPRRPARAVPHRGRMGRTARRCATPRKPRRGAAPARADPAAGL